MSDGIDLLAYPFPPLDDVAVAFSGAKLDQKLLAEAKRRGFDRGSRPGNDMFSKLFFSGGKIVFRDDRPDSPWRNAAWRYCRSLMGSFAPSHEDKEAVCGMLLEELVARVESKVTAEGRE